VAVAVARRRGAVLRVVGATFMPGLDGESAERKGARSIQRLFTYAAIRIVQAQIEGVGTHTASTPPGFALSAVSDCDTVRHREHPVYHPCPLRIRCEAAGWGWQRSGGWRRFTEFEWMQATTEGSHRRLWDGTARSSLLSIMICAR
jgi:hypothetical protein